MSGGDTPKKKFSFSIPKLPKLSLPLWLFIAGLLVLFIGMTMVWSVGDALVGTGLALLLGAFVSATYKSMERI